MRRTLDKRLKEDDVAESRRAIVMLRSSKAVILHEAVPAPLATVTVVDRVQEKHLLVKKRTDLKG